MLDKNTLENIIEYLESQIEKDDFIELEDSGKIVIIAHNNEDIQNIVDSNIDKILDEKIIKELDYLAGLLDLTLENIFEYAVFKLNNIIDEIPRYNIKFLNKYIIEFVAYKDFVFVYRKEWKDEF